MVPEPSFRVDWLSYAPKKPQGRPLVLLDPVVAESHQRSDGCWGSVELRDLVLVHNAPAAPCIWVRWDTLKDEGRHSVQKWPVRQVGVSSHPSTIRCAPIDITRLGVKDVLHGGVRAKHVASGRVQHPLGLSSRPTRVKHEQGIFGVHPLHVTLLWLACDSLLPPHVPPILHRALALRQSMLVLEHKASLHVVPGALADLESIINNLLKGNQLFAPQDPGSGDQDLALVVQDSVTQRVCAEAGKDNRVDCPDARARKHRSRELREHRHVDVHPIAPLHPHRLEVVGDLANKVLQLLVGQRGAVRGLIALPNDGHLVPPALLNVPV
mmetsp:Transcript_3836/g.13448  ORF Transcript_3836/g.13448 Transcript_3836/m.13448 type:complete len:325 (-) Transcript_3836:436-1410(-)